ncbi:SIR2 family protein [Salinisphaera sp. T5B8]|uniref:SIR2 family protein n=1 Tax=Salinisphaera sp. T5B8 TaxID=1304154 RepID=UPI00333F9A96
MLKPWLLERIKRGEAVLFLGAGSTFGATSSTGESPLSGDALKDQICDEFLGGRLKNKSLAKVAELAKNESSLLDVQNFVAAKFSALRPSEFHKKVASFPWKGIVTTNYDLVIERAYQNSTPKPVQDLFPIVRGGENFSEIVRNPRALPYLKLHGCISVANDERLPLILAEEEYAKYKKYRERLFTHLNEWAKDYTIVFCGYDIADPHIQQILFDIGDSSVERKQYIYVPLILTK